jgi:hypothetical protein
VPTHSRPLARTGTRGPDVGTLLVAEGPSAGSTTSALSILLSLTIGASALSLSGYFVPSIEFSLLDSTMFLGLFALGAATLAAIGGALRKTMLLVYSSYTVIASLAFVVATAYSAQYGPYSPVYLMDRYSEGDDARIYEKAVRPAIGRRDLAPTDGETNAPLHWYVNVRLEEAIVAMTGRPQMMLGNALSIVFGSITSALIVGAIGLALRTAAKKRFPNGIPVGFVLACPWLLAASIMAIRDVWLYAVFAAALYGGLAVSRWTPARRALGLAAVSLACGAACFFLRIEMTPTVVALVFIAGTTVKDRPQTGLRELLNVVGILVVLATTVVTPTLSGMRQDSVYDAIARRSADYSGAATFEAGAQGTVNGFIGGSGPTRVVFRTLWMPLQPLPRILIHLGNTYHIGKLLMPVWNLALLTSVLLLRRPRYDAGPHALPVLRRYRWLLLWMLAMTILVGTTSGESRHLYVVLPVACVVLADVFQTRATGPAEVVAAWHKGVLTGAGVLLFSIIFSWVFFGWDAMVVSG